MTLSAYGEEAFAAIVADVEADRRWHQVRRLFLALGAAIVALALLVLPSQTGWAPALAFAVCYAAGSVIAMIIGPRLFRRHFR